MTINRVHITKRSGYEQDLGVTVKLVSHLFMEKLFTNQSRKQIPFPQHSTRMLYTEKKNPTRIEID